MKLDELAKYIAVSPEKEKLEKISLTLNLYNGEETITGIYNIYAMFLRENNFWKDKENLPDILNNTKKIYSSGYSYLTDVLANNRTQTLNNWYRNFKYYLDDNTRGYNKELFQSTDPIIDIIVDITKEYSSNSYELQGFIEMITSNSKKVKGQIMAYEYLTKDSIITERKKLEKRSLNILRKEYEELLSNSDTFLSNHIKDSQDKVNEFEEVINTLKKEVEENINKHSSDVVSWKEQITSDIESLKSLYTEKLRLEAPATYWNKRADKLNKYGNTARNYLISLMFFTAAILIFWFFCSPTGVLSKVISGDAVALKWMFASITIVSFLAYGIRSLNKVMFSNYHLARDAEEREQLTHLYLALMKDNNVDKEDRNIVLQSLFSRADTGLLKEESSPTMPSAIIEKLTTK